MAQVIYELRVSAECAGQHALNVFHYYIDNPGVADDFLNAKAIVEALDDGGAPTSWLYRYQSMLAEDCFVSAAIARQIFPTGGNSYPQVFEPADFPGLATGNASALQLAGRINWFSEEAPDKVGGNFIPGAGADYITASRWSADYKDAAAAFIAKHVTGHTITGGPALPCIWDRTNELYYRIIDGYLSVKPGTQRRREKPI